MQNVWLPLHAKGDRSGTLKGVKVITREGALNETTKFHIRYNNEQYCDSWGGVISKYRLIFEIFGSKGQRYVLIRPQFRKRGLYLLMSLSQGSLYSQCNIPNQGRR